MEKVNDGIREIWFGRIRLGEFDQRVISGKKTPYWPIKNVTHVCE